MHDENLLQLINDDLAPAEQLLGLLQDESVALKGRDMVLLENILARKHSLVILLEQHGRKRSEILASHSSVGDQLLSQSELLNQLLAQCHAANQANGQSIQTQQAITANQLRILHGGETPSLYDARGTTSLLNKHRAYSQA